ncbi:MAG TPA: O-antigen ligase family protein [Opitutaceae bacterium]|nr:O-antigen ligase family protein [Opitutaceae bacterium]
MLGLTCLHLGFLPWALGTMHVWSQLTSLALATVTFIVALIPRVYSGELARAPGAAAWSRDHGTKNDPPPPSPAAPRSAPHGPRSQPNALNSPLSAPSSLLPPSSVRYAPWRRLFRFPIFWLGLALLGYIGLQAANPSWVWERNATHWWLRRVTDISWLPTSIQTPFERFNLWRQFIIYAAAWLTICALWIGLTRRRSIELLLSFIGLNGLLLAVTGLLIRLFRPPSYVLWFDRPWSGVTSFASFIYKNHAGAWLALAAGALAALGAFHALRSRQRLARSSPAPLFIPCLGGLVAAEAFTFSRVGTALLLGYLAIAVLLFGIHQFRHRQASAMNHAVFLSLFAVVAAGVAFSLSFVDFTKVEARFSRLLKDDATDISQRSEAYAASIEMLEDHWHRGVGAGGFRYLYPEYIKHRPAIYKGGRAFWEHAHNDWLQLPIELGAGGCTFILAGFAVTALGLVRKRFWRHLPVVFLVLGLAQTLVHALFDFPFQNPAVLITWTALLTIALQWADLDASA